MALNNAAADAALDVWIAGMNPPPTNPQLVRDGFRDLFRALYAGIVANAVVTPNTMTSNGIAVVGSGKIT